MYLSYINFENDPAYQQGHSLGYKLGFFIGEHWLLTVGVAFLVLLGVLFLIRRIRRKHLQKSAKPVNTKP